MRPSVVKAAGRRQRRKQETREALLGAALRLFGERGIYATRIEDITERADLGKGAFYNYFQSKEAIVGALVTRGAELLEAEHLGKLPPKEPLPARLGSVIRAHARFFEENRRYAVVFHQARGLLELEPEDAASLREGFAGYLQRVAQALFPRFDPARGLPAGCLDAAVVVVGAIAGYRSFGLATGVETSVETVTTALARGLPALVRR